MPKEIRLHILQITVDSILELGEHVPDPNITEHIKPVDQAYIKNAARIADRPVVKKMWRPQDALISFAALTLKHEMKYTIDRARERLTATCDEGSAAHTATKSNCIKLAQEWNQACCERDVQQKLGVYDEVLHNFALCAHMDHRLATMNNQIDF